jgi:hypothetical protein
MVIHPILGILMGILNPLNAWMTVPLRGKTNHVLTVAQKILNITPCLERKDLKIQCNTKAAPCRTYAFGLCVELRKRFLSSDYLKDARRVASARDSAAGSQLRSLTNLRNSILFHRPAG